MQRSGTNHQQQRDGKKNNKINDYIHSGEEGEEEASLTSDMFPRELVTCISLRLILTLNFKLDIELALLSNVV